MPLIYTAISFVVKWLLRSMIPYIFVAGGFVLAYFTGVLKSMLFWILLQFLTMLEKFVSWVSDGTTLFDYISFSSLPSEFLSFVVYLNVPEAFAIISTAYAIRLVRKALLRF